MVNIFVFNTLRREKEVFKPVKKGKVGMYSCGPTVYNYAHIGNLRTYLANDFIKRVFSYNKLKVNHVMNMTDVDDKTIKASREQNTSLKNLTRKYEDYFLEDMKELNILSPSHILRATESINDMVKIIKNLLKKGFAYKTSDGIYFSINKSKGYGKLAQLDKTSKKKERINKDEYEKNDAQDFALWKFYTPSDGAVFWDTEIGKGRPGWHIECSAMSMKILGKTIDIHTGATDLVFPHHTNEIAQSEAYTGKKFVNYWVHAGFLTGMDGKMSKSLGNVVYLKDIKNEGFEPIHYRYLCLMTHYRKPLLFSIENLNSAKSAFERIKRKILEIKNSKHIGNDVSEKYNSEFLNSINDDFNIPLALQVFYKVLDDFDFDSKKKLALIYRFDEVFGLGLKSLKEESFRVPADVGKLVEEREKMRSEKRWPEADVLRERIKDKGFLVQDTSDGPRLTKL